MFNSIENIVKLSQDLKLLYVEDNEGSREATEIILSEFFNEVVIAIDGKDGLEKFNINEIDIIITDINMPGLNGLEMIEKIREIDHDIPILVLSAYNESEYFMQSIKFSVDGYLLKPIQLGQFIQVLNKSIENLKLKKENFEYKHFLEEKIKSQVQELRERDAMLMQQAKFASMGEMIDAIGHQWMQPLNIITLQKGLIELDIKRNILDRENIQTAINMTTNQITHLIHTIGEFRNFFKPSYNIKTLNISILLQSIMLLLKDELIKYNVSVEIICDEDIKIEANENDIKHLFINLINNAKDEIILSNLNYENRVINVECSLHNEILNFLVKDQGRGIAEDKIDKIFKPHFTTKEDKGGTGIGLYMCKQIVQKYNGEISVENDKGAVFHISLPSSQ